MDEKTVTQLFAGLAESTSLAIANLPSALAMQTKAANLAELLQLQMLSAHEAGAPALSLQITQQSLLAIQEVARLQAKLDG